jgi:hypothetical protein
LESEGKLDLHSMRTYHSLATIVVGKFVPGERWRGSVVELTVTAAGG